MIRAVMLLGICATLTFCSDKNVYLPDHGSIAGFVRPAFSGATVAIADGLVSTVTRDDGFFLLRSIPSGIHDITIESDEFSRRVLHSILVPQGETRSLGEIELSHMPYPIFRTQPESGNLSVAPSQIPNLASDERLNLESLRALSTLTPQVPSDWVETVPLYYDGSPQYYHYSLRHDGSFFPLLTDYVLTVPADVLTDRGESLGRDVVVQFTTSPLTAALNVKTTGTPPTVDLELFDLRIVFNAMVHVDSLRKATVFDPPIEGVWAAFGGGATSFSFTYVLAHPRKLKPSTNYAVIIRDDVGLSGTHRLAESILKVFSTNGFMIKSPQPGGTRFVEPADTVRVFFNTPADSAATSQAISIRRDDGIPIGFSSSWDEDLEEIRLVPTAALQSDKHYTMTVGSYARSIEGKTLGYEHVCYIVVRQ